MRLRLMAHAVGCHGNLLRGGRSVMSGPFTSSKRLDADRRIKHAGRTASSGDVCHLWRPSSVLKLGPEISDLGRIAGKAICT